MTLQELVDLINANADPARDDWSKEVRVSVDETLNEGFEVYRDCVVISAKQDD